MTNDEYQAPTITTTVGLFGSFRRGPLDGSGYQLWVSPDHDLTDLRLSLPTGAGHRHLYVYDPQPDPDSLQTVMRYIGTIGGPA